ILARLAVEAGYPVTIAASGDPDAIALLTSVLAPGAEPKWRHAAIADADVVVLAMPLHRFLDLDPAPLAGKVVIDAMNYWPPVNGDLPEFDDPDRTSSEVVQDRLPGTRVVKTFNHIGYHELDQDARPRGGPGRRALGVAGDDPAAVALVADLVDAVGFDPVPLTGLAAGRVLQPGGPAFGAPLTREPLGDLV
ncbi:MAG: NAD(P)-binding domain-containing protein, partial [Actinobacteria bacterium]|nr:NAD(P)-binding domain-containing protein [Actinomycetota bacterium]